jgi:hypothetical protein
MGIPQVIGMGARSALVPCATANDSMEKCPILLPFNSTGGDAVAHELGRAAGGDRVQLRPQVALLGLHVQRRQYPGDHMLSLMT